MQDGAGRTAEAGAHGTVGANPGPPDSGRKVFCWVFPHVEKHQALDLCPAESRAGLPRKGVALARKLKCAVQALTVSSIGYSLPCSRTLSSFLREI